MSCLELAQARDKAATRLALKHNALPTPPVYEIRCDADVEPAAEAVGFPAVLKPVYGKPSGWERVGRRGWVFFLGGFLKNIAI